MPTVLHRMEAWAKEEPTSPAQRYKEGSQWKDLSAREVMDRVHALACYLESRGVGRDDVSVILSYNRPEWVQMDLAPLLLGAKSAGLYPNASKKDIQYILGHTEAKVLSVQNKEYFDRIGSDLPASVQLILVFEGDASFHPKAVPVSKAIEEGRKLAASRPLSGYMSKVDPNAGALMIYTSGTTGNPKGAVLTLDNLAYTSDIAIRHWKLKKGGGRAFSFLPLCHIAEKIQNLGVAITLRYVVVYCTKFDNLAAELPEARPTVLLAVPRLWEKMMEGVNAKLAAATGVKAKLAQWAFGVGARVGEARVNGRFVGPLDRLQLAAAEKLVLGKVKKALGLDAAELGASGAAALPAHVARWFRSLGIEILECFGQTESTGVVTMTIPGKDCAGTVGLPVEGTEFRIAEDGEILSRGRHVFKEYYKSPEATREAVDADGWLHTGDLGEYDSRGYVRIRGRKKEIMKTSGGKMIAPLPIEERIKVDAKISQVCIVGDGQKFFTALVTLAENVLVNLKTSNRLNGGKVVKDPEVLSHVQAVFDEVNSELAGYEKIKYFRVLAREFSVDEGEMTPTLKMKRATIESRFRDLIDEMYR